jgi:MOSC domain-containing protein YiiM
MTARARVTDVCVVHALAPGYFHDTAIDKRPLDRPVLVTFDGLDGDRQVDRSHGGRDAAVYVYAAEDAAYFASLLRRELPPGFLGENLRTAGLDVTGARIGERWRIGEVLLEVRKPRTPCQNLSLRVGLPRFHLEFHRTGRVGAMCRVLEPGPVAAGDEVVVDQRPDHDVTIGACVAGMDEDAARRLLATDLSLARSVRDRARRTVRRSAGPR